MKALGDGKGACPTFAAAAEEEEEAAKRGRLFSGTAVNVPDPFIGEGAGGGGDRARAFCSAADGTCNELTVVKPPAEDEAGSVVSAAELDGAPAPFASPALASVSVNSFVRSRSRRGAGAGGGGGGGGAAPAGAVDEESANCAARRVPLLS